jgi:hypothetical protein
MMLPLFIFVHIEGGIIRKEAGIIMGLNVCSEGKAVENHARSYYCNNRSEKNSWKNSILQELK